MYEFSPARTPRTFELISDQIREQLRNGALQPGDKLPPERTLAQQFRTSRNTVREALRALEHSGIIALQKGAHGGAFITEGDPTAVAETIQDIIHLKGMTLTDVTEARLLIEATIVGYATVKATEDDFSRLEDNINAVEALTRDGQLDSKAELNIQFHITLAECTKNPVLILIMRLLMDTLIAVHRPVTVEDTEDIIQSRRRFLSHLRKRDKKGATREMNNHLSHLHELFSA